MIESINKKDLARIKNDIDSNKNIIVYGVDRSGKKSFIFDLMEKLGDDYIGLCVGEMAYYCTLDDVWDTSKRMVNYNELDNLELFALAASHKVVIIATAKDYYKEVDRIQKLLNNVSLIIKADNKQPNSGYYTKEFMEKSTIINIRTSIHNRCIMRHYSIEN